MQALVSACGRHAHDCLLLAQIVGLKNKVDIHVHIVLFICYVVLCLYNTTLPCPFSYQSVPQEPKSDFYASELLMIGNHKS